MKSLRYIILCMLLLGVAAFMGCDQEQKTSKEAAADTVTEFIAAWQKKDMKACKALTTAEEDWDRLMEKRKLDGAFYTAEAIELYGNMFDVIKLREAAVDLEATGPENTLLASDEACVMASIITANLPAAEDQARASAREDGGVLRASSQVDAYLTYETYLNAILNDVENMPYWKGTVPVYLRDVEGTWLIDTAEGANDAFFSALIGAETFGDVSLCDILPEKAETAEETPSPAEKTETETSAPATEPAPEQENKSTNESPEPVQVDPNVAPSEDSNSAGNEPAQATPNTGNEAA